MARKRKSKKSPRQYANFQVWFDQINASSVIVRAPVNASTEEIAEIGEREWRRQCLPPFCRHIKQADKMPRELSEPE